MPIVLISDKFKGNLLELLGKKKSQALKGLPKHEFRVERQGLERFIWRDTVEDTDTGRSFYIYYMVRIFEGEVFEVCNYARDYLFLLDFNENDEPFFAAVPKGKAFDVDAVNWIRKESDKYINTGAV